MIYFEKGGLTENLSSEDMKTGLNQALDKIGKKKKVLAIPPDFTRFHSQAGRLTEMLWQHYGDTLTDILPALGTHYAMTSREIKTMFGDTPESLFRVHDWRNDVVTLGTVPAEYIRKISDNAVDYDWPAQVNKLLIDGDFDAIFSIGQIVPHEVVGMANHYKNIFVGTGGSEGINKSHFLGAAYGMERIMGRIDTPVRDVLNYAAEHYLDQPVIFIMTVVGRDEQGQLVIRGLYIGDCLDCYRKAADLSLQVNFEMLEKPLKKVVVYLDPEEFKSTWLGNKSIYRSRMAIADGGELIVLAPGLKEFGEDPEIDKLIRKYGYVGTPEVSRLVQENADLRNNLSAAAHLIHGSSEGRFSVTYCTNTVSKEEIESVNFKHADLDEMVKIYDPAKLKDGYNTLANGEEIFYISNPGLGLWATKERFFD